MARYMVHIRPEGETLPAELWETIDAQDRKAAFVGVLRRPHNHGHHPPAVWVADTAGNMFHPNGTPMIVHRFELQWGGPHHGK